MIRPLVYLVANVLDNFPLLLYITFIGKFECKVATKLLMSSMITRLHEQEERILFKPC